MKKCLYTSSGLVESWGCLDIRTITHIMSCTWCFYVYQTDYSWFFLVSKPAVLSSDDFLHCESTVKNWARASSDNGVKEDKFTLKDLLFFLHVPRTGGRTYFHWYVIQSLMVKESFQIFCEDLPFHKLLIDFVTCSFLRKLYTSNQECPRSYDKLRFDPRLLSSLL